MALTPKLLSTGTFSTTIADLYTAPANTTGLIKTITVDPENNFELYIKPGGGSAIRFYRGELDIHHIFIPLVLNSGDKIQGKLFDSGNAYYTISGAEQT
jgi:hypothetical protein